MISYIVSAKSPLVLKCRSFLLIVSVKPPRFFEQVLNLAFHAHMGAKNAIDKDIVYTATILKNVFVL